MKRQRTGFTLVELLVVIAIITILIGLLVPAVNAAREAGRNVSCQNKVKQLALAAIQYNNNKGHLPYFVNEYGIFQGGVDRSDLNNFGGAVPPHHKIGGFGVSILPWLEAQATYEHWTDDSYPVIADGSGDYQPSGAFGTFGRGTGFHKLAAPNLDSFQCPSHPSPNANHGRNSYISNNGLAWWRSAACASVTGSMGGSISSQLRSQDVNNGTCKAGFVGVGPPAGVGPGPLTSIDDLKDGQGSTAIYTENLQAMPWHMPGFVNGTGALPNLILTNTMPNTPLTFAELNPGFGMSDLGHLLCAQFTNGWVWHFEDPQATMLNGLGVTSPSGNVVANDLFSFHKINGGGSVAADDIYNLQMNLGNCLDLARPSSAHVEGVNVGFADGGVRFIRSNIDYRVYQAMMTPRGKSSDVPWPEFVLTDELDFE